MSAGYSPVLLSYCEGKRCSCRLGLRCPHPGKHPISDGWQELDPGLVLAEASRQKGTFNVGARTGRKAGLIVLDVDPRHKGDESLRALIAEHGRLGPARRVLTGGGGWHFHWRWPGDTELRLRGSIPGFPGLEVKGRGQTVLPPSIHESGKQYEWAPEMGLELELGLPPDWLMRLITASPKASSERGAPAYQSGESGTRFGVVQLWTAERWLREAAEGDRNNQLNRSAFWCGHWTAGGELDREAVEARLRATAQEVGLEAAEIEATMKSGLDKGELSPSRRSDLLSDPKTDVGNMERILRLFGRNLRYTRGRGWFQWDGRRWKEDEEGGVRAMAVTMTRALMEAATELAAEEQRGWLGWAVNTQSRSRVDSALSLAQTDPRVAVATKRMDSDPMLLLCGNGVIDLRTGELRETRPEYLITKGTEVPFDPAGRIDRFRDWLLWFCQGNPDLAKWLQTMAGLTLIGEVREHLAIFLWGDGNNGKTTFIELLSLLLGDYARSAPPTLLQQPRFAGSSGHSADIADLVGCRMVSVPETHRGSKLNAALLKELTGGDTISASFKSQNPFQFKPAFTLWMYGNYRPDISEQDEGTWRRIKLVHTEARVEHKVDRLHERLIEAEGPGILAWAVRGAQRYLRRRGAGEALVDAPSIQASTSEYRTEQDSLETFIRDRLVIGPNQRVANDQLWAAYDWWIREGGRRDFTTLVALKRALAEWGRRRGLPIEIPDHVLRFGTRVSRGMIGVTVPR